jgi:hypothetical protein
MAQHDFDIANQTFPNFRSDLNDALQAAATTSAGASAPTTPYAYQLWYDTVNGKYKIRNAGNTAWLDAPVGGDLVDDTTPQLGGDLDLNSSDITGTGDINITGDVTVSGGLYVGGTGSANYLDDYEEGTWTPFLVGGTTTTYGYVIGSYTKIGQLVYVQFDMTVTSIGNGSTNTIGGAPFSNLGNDALAVSYWSGLAVSPYFVGFQAGSGTFLAVGTTGAQSGINNGMGIFGNGCRIIASGCYRTSA